jgi:NADH-quinone oxidoreductase subunit K
MIDVGANDPTFFYLVLGGLLFSLGAFGVLIRRNIIVIFMCVELMLNSVNLTLIALSNHFRSIDGQIYIFFVMAIAAAEAAVGLAIVISVFSNFYSVDADDVHLLQG